MLQKKYHDSLNNYPQTRLTPKNYESIERPNSVTGAIKLRKSYDSNHISREDHKLEMYSNKSSNQKLSNARYANKRIDQ